MISQTTCPKCGAQVPSQSTHQLCPKCLLAEGLGQGAGARSAATEAYVFGQDDLGWTQEDLESRFPQLEILDLIGRGGMGAVYRARQKTLDRIVALKVLPARASRAPSFAERFVREARTMAKLNHPNVVTVHEFGEQDGLYYFLMEFVDGANLRSLMSEGSLRSTEALSIVGQVCDALQYAHESGIVHRDIKPENVLIDQRGQVKIADFGLAKILAKPTTDVTLTGVHQVVGTPHYMAPEQMEKPTEVDHRADIYSLGVVFYELLTGELPLGRFAPPSEKASINATLDDVVLRTLEKEPANRYQSAFDMKSDCSRIVDAPTSGPTPAPEPQRDNRPAKERQHSLACTLPSQFEGLYDYVGLVKYDEADDYLVLQYRGQEAFTGSSLAGTKEHVFPLSKVDTIELKYGMSGHTMLVTPNDLKIANKVPGMEKGKVRIKFVREDRGKAEALVRACAAKSKIDAEIPVPPTEEEALRDLRAPALAMLLYGMVCIMISLVSSGATLWTAFDGNSVFKNFVLGGSALSGVMNVLVVVGAVNMHFARNRSLAFAAAICCCIPSGPASAAGIGLGIWALVVLNREEITELFKRMSEDGGSTTYGFLGPSDGKPPGRDALRQEAAARLRAPCAILRTLGWISLVGLVASLLVIPFGGIWFNVDWLKFGQFPAWVYVLIVLLANGCSLLQLRTDRSRATMITLSIIAVLPISLVWPISVVFGAWALLVLMDPEVSELQQDEPLPPAKPTDAMRVTSIIVLATVVPLVMTLFVRNLRTIADKPRPMDWKMIDPYGAAFTVGDKSTLLRRLNDRLDDVDADISVELVHDDPSVNWSRGDADEQLRIFQLMASNGRIEVGLVRDADPDAQGATDGDAQVDLLQYRQSGSATPAGLRLAVVTDTRWKLTINDLDDFDLSSRSADGESQTLRLELNDSSIGVLVKRLEEVLKDRPDEDRPLQFVLIVDRAVHGSSKTVINKENPPREIRFQGSFPWRAKDELDAVLQSGPLGGSVVQAGPVSESE